MLVASVFGVEGDDVVLPVDVHPVELTLPADLKLVTLPGRDQVWSLTQFYSVDFSLSTID